MNAITTASTPRASDRTTARPGWPELSVGAAVYALTLALGIWWIDSVPSELGELRGWISYFVSGATGVLALVAAILVRRLSLASFGFRTTSWKWVAVAIAAGIGVYWVNQLVALAYIALFGNDTPQADYQAAASGSPLSLAVTLVLGAGLTGLGEEVFFRGVVANVLWRYGAWAGIFLSAIIFAVVHGFNLILPIALVVGIVNAILFRRSGSIWTCVIVHVMYNGISNVGFLLVA
ncbi:CPBP family intramembrane glutamic endopeptidase [Microlunatus speluncae]|uniref:CPBP family intramembrane glutamic endopeptidase n=1 Tax=Microlunatus speluncae TaxID=2594267 RepID=UPI001375AD1D|nr:type II CAAX endopeptidase family protein [Microlunatus speluncae]